MYRSTSQNVTHKTIPHLSEMGHTRVPVLMSNQRLKLGLSFEFSIHLLSPLLSDSCDDGLEVAVCYSKCVTNREYGSLFLLHKGRMANHFVLF